MNRDQAYDLVRQTFTQAFEKNRFLHFSKNLLNRIDESKASVWSNQRVKDAFKEHVQHYERLGTYETPEKEKVDLLIVHLTKQSKLERARTSIRNFVADHLKTRDEKDAALVAFVSPTEKQWRFSYVKMEYATVEKESLPDPARRSGGRQAGGKVGVEARLTPARRFSYIVGEGESCHTAQTRFLNLLQDTETDPALADFEEAFSVEAVTDEFFKQYRSLFEEFEKEVKKLVTKYGAIRDEFKAKNVNPTDFAKKLMGQIVFLYFLQKKGWLGVEKGKEWGTGPHDFLRRLADRKYGNYDNFFNDVLEPLFYDTLATDRGHEAWDNRFNCRIPFLNGGLFEPLGDYDWKKTDITLPNRLFFNNEHFEGDIKGTGVLDVFDRYNFTVNEAEPLEKEVAIDPEMLGKVFENLIEDNRRKGLGAYYTPREIVHYMCQESLINYLDTALNAERESLTGKKPKQAALFPDPEPAKASLQVERYNEVVPRTDIETFIHLGEQISHYEAVETKYRVKMLKSIEENARAIDEKLKEITICDPAVGSGAFPVGMMTEIVRARTALTPYFNDVHDRTAYHFKRHSIQNCLYGVDVDTSAVEIAKLRLWLSLVVDEEDVKHIKPLPNLDYRIVVGNSLVGLPDNTMRDTKIEDEIERLKIAIFNETNHEKKQRLRLQIDGKIRELLAAAEQFTGYPISFDFWLFFSEVFHIKDGFDVTIANPPYVRQEKLKDLKPILARQFETYTGVADLYVYFYERGIKLLNRGGTLAFISSNKFFRAGYGEKLRKFLTDKAVIATLIDFGDLPVFEATTYPCVLVARKSSGTNGEAVVRARTIVSEDELKRFEEVFRSSAIEMPQSSLAIDGWRIEGRSVLALLEKIKKAGVTLEEYVYGKIYYGIKTGYNEAYVIDAATKERLVKEDKRSAGVIKPFLRGRDIGRYGIDYPNLNLIFIPWDFDIKEYPCIGTHLKQFKSHLVKRPEAAEGRFPWYAMSRYGSDYHGEFEKEKIVFSEIAVEGQFALDSKNCYLDTTVFMIGSESRYLLGLLNSRLVTFAFSKTGSQIQGGFLRWKRQYMELLPIATPSDNQRCAIEERVEKILAAKKKDGKADTTSLEREIDQLVYKLYGLNEQEIKIVEDSTRRVEGTK